MLLCFWVGLRTLRGGTARWSGALAVVCGVAALFLGAIGWAGGTLEGLPLFVQLLSLSAVSGGSLAAVILAHWYLVTPRISEQPLVLTTRLLTVALSLQLLLFLVWLAVGYPSGAPFAALTGPQALFVWLRLLVGILFPLLLCCDGLEDRPDPVDGVRDRPAVHRAGARPRIDHRGRRPGVRGRRAGLSMEIRVRLFAMQRQQLGWRDRPHRAARSGDHRRCVAGARGVATRCWLMQAAASGSPATVPTRTSTIGSRTATSWRSSHPWPAGRRESYRRIELWPEPFPDELVPELRHAVSSSADGAVVVFLGQTRESAGTPAPGQEAAAASLAGSTVERLEYEAFETMALSVLDTIADEIEARFGVRRLVILHRTG